jgi:glutathione peroxidase
MIAALLFAGTAEASMSGKTAYEFSFMSIEGEPLPLSAYCGRAILVVNTASLCGFTRQYGDLQALYEKYRDQGLIVLGVPSNDFGNQEPGEEAEIKSFCEINYGIDFPMTEKTKVTGSRAHPFYKWAAGELGSSAKPRWNFHKYLVGPDGRLVGWFSTSTSPMSGKVIRAVELQLKRAE